MIVIVDCGSTKVPFIEKFVEKCLPYISIKLDSLEEELIQNVQGIIISGAPILLTEVNAEHYVQKMNWLKTYSKPVLGICFGHQILGMVYGASIARQKEDRSWQEIEIIQDSELFENFGKTVLMVEDHCESISVPPHFNLLASSDACVNEAMQHQEKKMFGVQFHPEVSGDNGEKIITNFIEIVKKSKP